jgi:mono/diheme cytochrome c family protein
MSARTWFHILAVAVVCIVALLVVALHRASGQTMPRDTSPVARGQSLVQAWCLTCHGIGRHDGSGINLNFEAIAQMPSTTELSLRVFLQSNHRNMPNIIVKGRDLDDIVAFIMSLKRE